MAFQCMDFCYVLASHEKIFTFSLTIGSTFAFSLDTRESLTPAADAVKRKNPSARRRNCNCLPKFNGLKSTLPCCAPQVLVIFTRQGKASFLRGGAHLFPVPRGGLCLPGLRVLWAPFFYLQTTAHFLWKVLFLIILNYCHPEHN